MPDIHRFHRRKKYVSAAGLNMILAAFVMMLVMGCVHIIPLSHSVYAKESTEAQYPSDSTEDMSGPMPGDMEDHVLVLFSYTPSWSGESDVYEGLVNTMRSSVRMDLVFMDTKNIDKKLSEEITLEHVDLLLNREKYNAVIAVDDDALDFILRNREDRFKDIPVIFNNINSRERAEQTAKDPLITGIYENFFGAQTLEVATRLYPDATRVVGISDHSLTGLAMAEQFREIKSTIEDLDYEILDMMDMTREEITEKISSFGKETILLYLNFTQDKDGNIYGMKESYHFLTSITDLPLFKPDQGGIGMGILGGCGGSYVEVGERTAQMVMDVLDGADMTQMPVEDMEGTYLFDASLLKRYGITKSALPSGTRYVNEDKSIWEEYAIILRPLIVVTLLLVIIVVLLIADRRRLASLIHSQQKLSDAEVRRRKAESQSTAITQFLSSVSHDIRTPLVSIIGYTDLALKEDDQSRRTEYLEKIQASGNLLTTLVNDTLDVSRSISGKSRIHLSNTTFDEIAEGVIVSVSENARKKGVSFTYSVEDGGLPVRADRMKLQKIILNLLTNAVKFTPQGGKVELYIDHLTLRENGCNFRITVSDTGVGMSEDFQKIMFEPFVQENVDPLHMGVQNGTGLGLTIVRNNIEQMGGHIHLDSKVGHGSTFKVYLPIDVLSSEQLPSETSDKKDYESLRGLNVLVVEDSDMNTEVIKAILTRKGINSFCVADGSEAVETFANSQAGTFDVIFMDLRMPKMNGYEAARKIRSLQREDAKSIPIFALSADVYDSDIKRALSAGMNGHIAKPIRPETLYDVLLGLNIR